MKKPTFRNTKYEKNKYQRTKNLFVDIHIIPLINSFIWITLKKLFE